MAIPESQLETWAKQGATVTAKSTADSIKNALDSYGDWPDDADFEVFLQGSYKNNTNIRGDSDVDVVAQLNSTFRSNLTEEEKRLLGISEAYYKWQNFRNDVIKALREYYGISSIQEGRKAIKVSGSNGRLPADVVVCIQYRKYISDLSKFYKGMTFWVPSESRWVINYPKSHYNNGVNKNQNTSLWYKRAVRILKNSRGHISRDATPSYFLECMIYNVPDPKFGGSYQDTFCEVVDWLNQANLDDFVCQNGHHKLFGLTPEQWNTNGAKSFIQNIISLWNNW